VARCPPDSAELLELLPLAGRAKGRWLFLPWGGGLQMRGSAHPCRCGAGSQCLGGLSLGEASAGSWGHPCAPHSGWEGGCCNSCPGALALQLLLAAVVGACKEQLEGPLLQTSGQMLLGVLLVPKAFISQHSIKLRALPFTPSLHPPDCNLCAKHKRTRLLSFVSGVSGWRQGPTSGSGLCGGFATKTVFLY